MIRYYAIPKSRVKDKEEIGEYEVEGSLTTLSRGTFLAYGDHGLTTGFKTEKEAREWLDGHTYNDKEDMFHTKLTGVPQ
jgi:hypothetical protein